MGKVALASIIGDNVIAISALILAILSVVGVMNMIPPAAAYTLFGVSGVIALSWIYVTIRTKGASFTLTASLFKAALSSDPHL